MEIMQLPLDALTPDPENARLHPRRNLDILIGSLRQFGQVRPFVVRCGSRVITVGNGMYQAMREMGWTEPVYAVEKELTDAQAAQLAILDNRACDLSSFDDVVLWELLQGLDTPLREASGFTDAELEALFATPEPDFRAPADFSGAALPDTIFQYGGIGIRVSRSDFDRWHAGIRAAVGLTHGDIIDEIKRRLELC